MENETELFDTDASSSLADAKADDTIDNKAGTVVTFVEELFSKSETARYTDEQRWLKAYRNYRGIYGSDVQFTETEKSQVFVKVTKTKTLAAYGQVTDVLFGNAKFPLTVNPTTLPDGVVDSVHFNTNAASEPGLKDIKGAFDKSPAPITLFTSAETRLKPGETMTDLMKRVGSMSKKLGPVADKLVEGPGTTPTDVTFSPAMVAAKKMEKQIHDQLEESGASKHLRSTAFELVLFGEGIMKGPFALNKEYPSWNDEGDYEPIVKTVPATSHVSIWNFYPDPDAANMDDAEYCVERHKMSRSQMRQLKRRPFFRANSIDMAIQKGESYEKKWWELEMEDDASRGALAERYEVLEYWGYVDTDKLKDYSIDIPSDLKNIDQLNVNIWVCNGQVLRLVMNPFKPSILPYYAVPYEINPYSFFGIGLAENMEDTQTLMNGFMRMAVDNAVLSGNLVFEVDETNLVPGQDLKMYPGKVIRRQGGAPGQALFGTKFPNVSNENMQMFDKARVLADESTGIPSFSHGQTGVSGVGRTASGISMLMSAANGSIRTVVKNIDDYLLAPLGKAFFNFNMQFNYDPEIKGDLEVKAQGTESLMANEIRSQRLMQFLQTAQNPVLMPFVKADYIIREIAKSLDLDPDKVVNNLGDAAIQAEILKKFAQPAPPPQGGPQPPEGGAPMGGASGVQAPSVSDPTGAGGGNMGTGVAPGPGEAGFSANTGGAMQ
jgi:hypothetical protein